MNVTKSITVLTIGIIISACATANNDLPETYFDCQHKHDDRRSFIVQSPVYDIKHTQANNCPEIIKQDGECPVVIEIQTLRQDTIYLSGNEMSNYNCKYNENKNETK